jgi:hypothetical protein
MSISPTRVCAWILIVRVGTVLFGLCSNAAAVRAACQASAVIDGEPVAVAKIRSELDKRGVGEPTDSACAAAHAWITSEDGRFRVRIQDGAGRESEHVVSDPISAAILVESWVRPELATWTSPVDPPRPAPRMHLSARGELGVDVTGATAYGASADATVNVGVFRLGATARVREAPGLVPGALNSVSRNEVEGLVDAARPIHAGRLSITPGIGIGVGWLSTGGTLVSLNGIDASVSRIGLRTTTEVAFAFALSPTWAIELVAAVDVAPFAHVDPVPIEMKVATLPGEPWLTAHAGLGLAMGLP